jgi:hypothetical protein
MDCPRCNNPLIHIPQFKMIDDFLVRRGVSGAVAVKSTEEIYVCQLCRYIKHIRNGEVMIESPV